MIQEAVDDSDHTWSSIRHPATQPPKRRPKRPPTAQLGLNFCAFWPHISSVFLNFSLWRVQKILTRLSTTTIMLSSSIWRLFRRRFPRGSVSWLLHQIQRPWHSYLLNKWEIQKCPEPSVLPFFLTLAPHFPTFLLFMTSFIFQWHYQAKNDVIIQEITS